MEERAPQDTQLAGNSIGFIEALAIGLNSTSPAYSIAAIIGPVAALVGAASPGILVASFIPMLLIASAFAYLNKVDTDCGTTFSWATRAIGPTAGWLAGWAIALTGVLVVGSLANVAVRYTLLTFGQDTLADNVVLTTGLTVAVIAVMAWVCVAGTSTSARLQTILTIAQVGALALFIGFTAYAALSGDAKAGAEPFSLAWFNPFSSGTGALTAGLLLGVFAYWGWESALNLSEECKDGSKTPGRAGIASTIILVGTYVGVAVTITMFAGPAFLSDNADNDIFAMVAADVLGPLSWIVLAAVATAALASAQTTIIPASRTALSMARRGAFPAALGRIHPRYRTPANATWLVAGIAAGWFVLATIISENALVDSLSALSMLIAFYYALTGFACAIYYRKHLRTSAKAFLLVGVGPVAGAVMLTVLLVTSVRELANPDNSASGAWFGLGPPLVIGAVLASTGVAVMLVMRARRSPFFTEPRHHVDPDTLTSIPTAKKGPSA